LTFSATRRQAGGGEPRALAGPRRNSQFNGDVLFYRHPIFIFRRGATDSETKLPITNSGYKNKVPVVQAEAPPSKNIVDNILPHNLSTFDFFCEKEMNGKYCQKQMQSHATAPQLKRAFP